MMSAPLEMRTTVRFAMASGASAIAVSLILLIGIAGTLGVLAAAQTREVPVEDWAGQPLGSRGAPSGWKPYETPGGRPAYDFTVVVDEGRHALRLRSRDEHSTIARPLTVDLDATPVLEWSWKILTLPPGADVRKRETSDLTAHLYVVWARFPAVLRSRLIGYAWDTTAPAGTIEKSRKTRTTTFFVLHSGTAETGRWITERRDVRADYVRIFGEAPDRPSALALSIDTNDTHATAEGLIGRIVFRSR